MIDRRVVEHFDWGLLLITLTLCGLGLVALYSALYAGTDMSMRPLFVKQLVWLGGGFGIMAITFCVDPKEFERWTPGIYIGCLILLVAVLLVGRVVGGSRRWLVLGSFTLQPSEPAKIGVILMLARHYARNATTRGLGFRELIQPAAIVMFPFLLIYLQPDLGTGLLIVMIAGVMTLFVKIERRTLMAMVGAGLGLAVAAWLFFLKAYQKERVLTFLNPDRDPLGSGYHIIQSKIAIGSGMLTGKGFLQGTQNTLSFLPERHTDFILSVLAEEWGFLGTMVLVLLYGTLFLWGLNIAHKSRNTFGTITTVGVTAMLFWEAFINMGMVMGLMPVVGVPLPLVSYGGSSVVTSLVAIGLLMGVSMRRFKK